uniref:Uncharacterized protein n=1 Tax=Anguilla anguilla TaxID=7936 RepID=A0A0E9RQN9_ANGAN
MFLLITYRSHVTIRFILEHSQGLWCSSYCAKCSNLLALESCFTFLLSVLL